MTRKRIALATAPEPYITKDYLPSVGLGYIAAVLEKTGYEVYIVDSYIHGFSAEEAAETIVGLKPDAVGITSTSHNRSLAIKMMEEIKKQREDILVIAGGKHFGKTDLDALHHIPELDIVVRGDGEETVPELLNAHFAGSDLSKVLGVTYRSTGSKVVRNSDRNFITDLNSLPSPAWHLFEHERYDAMLEGEYKTRSIGFMSSRGCPNSCVFCANDRRSLRRMDPERFVNEIEFLHTEYGYCGFDVWDDTFTVVRKHAEAICQEILARGLDIKWYARARANTVDQELLKLMKRAGCVAISYGVESGSQRILKNIGKGITVANAREATKMSLDLGFYVKAFFMFSLPGETLEDVKKTLELMEELKKHRYDRLVIMTGITIIYPGTDLERLAKNTEILSPDFSWNERVEFEKPKKLGGNPTLPYFENPELPVEDIMKFVHYKRYSWRTIVPRTIRYVRNIRSIEDIKTAMRLARNFVARP
jgi:anaerobic magnesium-protoporphyrin IX monomethyl ester cyclase